MVGLGVLRCLRDECIHVGGLTWLQGRIFSCTERPSSTLPQVNLDGSDGVTAIGDDLFGVPPMRVFPVAGNAGDREAVRERPTLSSAPNNEVHSAGERVEVVRI